MCNLNYTHAKPSACTFDAVHAVSSPVQKSTFRGASKPPLAPQFPNYRIKYPKLIYEILRWNWGGGDQNFTVSRNAKRIGGNENPRLLQRIDNFLFCFGLFHCWKRYF